MVQRSHIGLDNPAFRGRLRQPGLYPQVSRPRPVARQRLIDDFSSNKVMPKPPQPKQSEPPVPVLPPSVAPPPASYSRLQMSLVGLAGLIFMIGVLVSLDTVKTNHDATAQVSALSKQASSGQNSPVPATAKPSSQTLSQYTVAPDLPRYLKISKLGVDARVRQVGLNQDGSLAAPSNVYDAAWYTASARPGQAGATLIDGHVSSWTTRGVFYGLSKLVAGDTVQIVRGDGTVLNYKVIKTVIYPADKVDMQAAMTPVTAGKSGLNLITCSGQVQKGTSQYKQRLIVFTEQL